MSNEFGDWEPGGPMDYERDFPPIIDIRRREPRPDFLGPILEPAYGPGNPPPESEPTIHTQEEFLTALDVLLDHTLHADECYCDPNDTVCVCVIGKVRATLPPCGATRIQRVNTQGAFGGEGQTVYKCTRNAHPASPDRHVFG